MRRLLLALCAVTLLSGCGGGVDASLLATAVHKTQAAGGVEMAIRADVDVPGRAEPVVMTGSGVSDATGQRAQMTMDMPGGAEMEVVGDGFTMYIRSDLFGDALGGKEWMKLDTKRTSESLGIDTDSLAQMGQSSSDQLEMLEKVSGGVTEEGHDEVVGVETTHYSATIDLRNYPGQDLDKLIELTGQTEMDVDVWIDDEQRVRRMEWNQSLRKNGTTVEMHLTTEFVRFGVPVDIDIPDEDDVLDVTDFAARMMERMN